MSSDKDPFLNEPPVIIANVGQNKPQSYDGILALFRSSIVELKFKRRNFPCKDKKAGHRKSTRRMLCTANWKLISNIFTRRLFGWKSPLHRRGPSWYKQRNLLIVWDFMKDDFRIVSLDEWEIIAVFNTTKFFDRAKFIAFYKYYISKQPQIRRDGFSDE